MYFKWISISPLNPKYICVCSESKRSPHLCTQLSLYTYLINIFDIYKEKNTVNCCFYNCIHFVSDLTGSPNFVTNEVNGWIIIKCIKIAASESIQILKYLSSTLYTSFWLSLDKLFNAINFLLIPLCKL